MISEKNILKTDLEGKNSYKEIPGEKIPTLEKFLYWRILLEKKSYTVERQKMNSIATGFSLLHSDL